MIRGGHTGEPVLQVARVLSGDHQLRQDSLNYFISKIVPGLLGLLTVTTFVRLVGYEQYGRYAVMLSVVMTAASWSVGWLTPGILRFSSNYRSDAEVRGFRSAVLAGLAASLIIAGLAATIAAGALLGGTWSAGILAIVLAVSIVAYSVTSATLQAGLRSSAVARLEIARAILGYCVPVIAILVTGARHSIVLLTGAAAGYLLPLMAGEARRGRLVLARADLRAFGRTWMAARPVLTQIWRYGWPVALWSLVTQLFPVIDRYWIQHADGYAATGVYASVYDVVVRSFSLVFFPITLATHPIAMQRWNSGEHASALAVIRASIKYQTLLGVPIVAAVALFGPDIARMVLGAEHPEAARLVGPLAAGGCLWQVSLLVHKPLEMLCHTRKMLHAIAVALAVSLIGNYLLIPRYGMVGAAYVTTASAAAYILVLLLVTPFDELRRLSVDGVFVPADAALPLPCAAASGSR